MPKPTLRLEYHAPNARKKIRVRNVTSTELDRLRHIALISREQHDAGEAAMRDLWKAGMLGPAAVNFGGGGGGGDPQPISSSKSHGLKAVNLWITALDLAVGGAGRRLLMTLLCDDRFAETPANVVAIRQALTATMRIHELRRQADRPSTADRIRQSFGLSSE
jgi:hypothetical protein